MPVHCRNPDVVRHSLTLGCCAAAIALLGACATPVFEGDPNLPLTATLPLRSAHVTDGRAAFAAAFQRELSAAASGGTPADAAAHLRLAAPAGGHTAAPAAADLRRLSVLIVPGLFGDCFDDQAVPFGDGVARTRDQEYTQAYRIYDDLGLAGIRTLRISGRASSAANAEVVVRELLAEAARPEVERIVLIGYSKGVPDLLEALAGLQREQRVPSKLHAVVSVAGVVMGTPIADKYGALYETVGGAMELVGCPTSAGGEVQSLMRSVRVPWLASAVLPASPRYYTLVAHADRDDVSPGLRRFNTLLSTLDPRNDGQMLAPEAILPGSTLLAVVKSDHWSFVLPLVRSPRPLVKSRLSTGTDFPREALFRAIVRTVGAPRPN